MKDIIMKFATSATGTTTGTGTGTGTVTGTGISGGDQQILMFDSGGDLQEKVMNIINVVIGLLGIVAVIVIILGGIQYMTSSGDAGKVKKAKDTILYGVIGLIVCILAFAIVNFVISKFSN